jgi:hypothetical protein
MDDTHDALSVEDARELLVKGAGCDEGLAGGVVVLELGY